MGRSSVLPLVTTCLIYVHASSLTQDFILVFVRNVYVRWTFAGADRGDRLQGAAGLHRRGRHHGAQLPLL